MSLTSWGTPRLFSPSARSPHVMTRSISLATFNRWKSASVNWMLLRARIQSSMASRTVDVPLSPGPIAEAAHHSSMDVSEGLR